MILVEREGKEPNRHLERRRTYEGINWEEARMFQDFSRRSFQCSSKVSSKTLTGSYTVPSIFLLSSI